MVSDATSYVKSRFPAMPVLVTVKIDPLRRDTIATGLAETESLPYLSNSPMEILDEWDDPSRSLHELVPRIRSTFVTVSLPKTVTDQELNELREALTIYLNLIQGRDRVDFERRDWAYGRDYTYEIGVASGLVLLFLLGMYLAMRLAAGRIASSVAHNPEGGQAREMGQAPMSMPTNSGPSSDNSTLARGNLGQVRFDDPIKVRTQIKAVVDELTACASFPQLEDMLILDRKAMENPSALGAALIELPTKLQDRLFQFGIGERWLATFSDPGQLELASYELLYRLAKRQRAQRPPKWDELLLLVWRLGDTLPDFLRAAGQENGIAILANMPAQIAIPAGKRAFPGGWGILLDPSLKRNPLPEKLVDEMRVRAVTLLPLNSLSMLEVYRHERGVLDYLHTAPPPDEQDIYQAVGQNSIIHRLRPPFYVVFDLDAPTLKRLINAFPMESWALAMFNVPRDRRKQLENALSDKQKYFLIEFLRQLDQQHPSEKIVGEMREAIARHYHKIHATSSLTMLNPAVAKAETPPSAEKPAGKKKAKAKNADAA